MRMLVSGAQNLASGIGIGDLESRLAERWRSGAGRTQGGDSFDAVITHLG